MRFVKKCPSVHKVTLDGGWSDENEKHVRRLSCKNFKESGETIIVIRDEEKHELAS